MALLTLPETAQALRVSEATIYRLMRRGEISVIKLNGRTLVEATELRRLINERRVTAAEGP